VLALFLTSLKGMVCFFIGGGAVLQMLFVRTDMHFCYFRHFSYFEA
jgi:hypothetical protein